MKHKIRFIGGRIDGEILEQEHNPATKFVVPFMENDGLLHHSHYVLRWQHTQCDDGSLLFEYYHSRDSAILYSSEEIAIQRKWIADYNNSSDRTNVLDAEEFAGLLDEALDKIESLIKVIHKADDRIDRLVEEIANRRV